MTEQQAMQIALETLEEIFGRNKVDVGAINALRQALEQQPADPIVGTKTWFEDGKIVQQELKYSEVYKQPADEPDWKALVLNHNADCESRCDMDRCGYKPYFEYNRRRCLDCPVHEAIDVGDYK